jgi:hypothetical protein
MRKKIFFFELFFFDFLYNGSTRRLPVSGVTFEIGALFQELGNKKKVSGRM